ncbi:MAG TPA: ABC transporter ATP-binding protein [Candidatus Latescibacteria bacterium]|nr:ABC transporter ATP-binding protein [Candidatus Latescibacterota bacterium]
MLQMRNVNAYYGRVQALKGISLHVLPGEIVCLIGANGAGKTTILRSISGLLDVLDGEIRFNGTRLTDLAPDQIVRLGISHVPEGRQLFGPLTVIDNLRLGAYQRYRRSNRSQIQKDIEYVFQLFPLLEARASNLAGTLSGGEQQMLAIGRALMSRPKLLLLDEPSMGLAPMVAREIFEVIKDLREGGTTILLVEQNARMALSLADRGYVLETGKIIIEGPSAELLENREVKRAYLGKGRKGFFE